MKDDNKKLVSDLRLDGHENIMVEGKDEQTKVVDLKNDKEALNKTHIEKTDDTKTVVEKLKNKDNQIKSTIPKPPPMPPSKINNKKAVTKVLTTDPEARDVLNNLSSSIGWNSNTDEKSQDKVNEKGEKKKRRESSKATSLSNQSRNNKDFQLE